LLRRGNFCQRWTPFNYQGQLPRADKAKQYSLIATPDPPRNVQAEPAAAVNSSRLLTTTMGSASSMASNIMPRITLLDMFTHFTPPTPAPDLALEASFGLQDIERLLRENKALKGENKALKAKLRDIDGLITAWQESIRRAAP
jgi:hypothetical protein